MTMSDLTAALAGAAIDDAVLALRPDYRALLVVVTGVRGGPSDDASDAALRRAEAWARARLAGAPPESLPEIAAWREAFLGFGVKPRAARSSVEALLRRVDAGLPRIDRLTDHYNAVSVEHLVPVGGEDLDRYVGPPRLVRAGGRRAVRHRRRRRARHRDGRPRRGAVARRPRRHLPPVELAPVRAHPPRREHQHDPVHPRRAGPDDDRGPRGRRRGARSTSSPSTLPERPR